MQPPQHDVGALQGIASTSRKTWYGAFKHMQCCRGLWQVHISLHQLPTWLPVARVASFLQGYRMLAAVAAEANRWLLKRSTHVH